MRLKKTNVQPKEAIHHPVLKSPFTFLYLNAIRKQPPIHIPQTAVAATSNPDI
jgi:hypothetical protein